MSDAIRLRNLANGLRAMDPRDIAGAARPAAQELANAAADQLEQLAATIGVIDERSFNAGFDAVGLAMQQADPRSMRTFRTTHPQWRADRAEAFRKAQGFTS